METFESGAARSGKKLRCDLVMPELIRAVAERATIGAEKYGDDNFKKGGPDFFKQAECHLWAHYLNWKDGTLDDEKELKDHLKAMAWNIGALLWWEEHKN